MGRGPSKKRAKWDEDEDEEEEALLFAIGAEVEVGSTDDPGFAGSFYEGTVEAHLSGGYVVAYSTLESDDDADGGSGGGRPLREEVRAAEVRPRPTGLDPPAEGFAMHEMVEAFHNEGWWSGVVTALPLPLDVGPARQRRRVYTVAFPTSREVMEFDEAALRPLQVFRRRRWIPAAHLQDDGSSAFQEGSLVEVSRSPESFGESWNPATVLKVIGSTNFLVQYRHVGGDGELVTEIVDYQYIRPARAVFCMDSKYRFSVSSHVEVFYKGSWWPAIVLEASNGEFGKIYTVKLKNCRTGMDDVEFVDKLTVENTVLRPQCDWDGRKWMRCVTKAKKPVNKRPPLTSRKKPITADSALSNDSDEIRDKTISYFDKMLKTADVVPRPINPLMSVCDGCDKIKDLSSYPKGTMKQQNAVLALASQTSLPLQSSITGSGRLKYDSLLTLDNHTELSSQMDIMPSVPQSGDFQASLFGMFGQLRPIPQGPLSGMQSPRPNVCRFEGSKKASTDQEKQSIDEGCSLISSARNSFNFGSFAGIDMSRKRKECVSFQAPKELGMDPKTTKKSRVDKRTEGTHNIAAVSDECPQERCIADIFNLSGIDDLCPEENQILPATSASDNYGDVNLLSADSSTEKENKTNKSDECEISLEEDSGEEFCRRFLVMPDDTKVDEFPSAKIGEANRHDDLVCMENFGAIVECVTNCTIPTENFPVLCPAMFDDVVLNQSSVNVNCQNKKNDGLYKVGHEANVLGLASTNESGQSMDDSTITRLSSFDTSQYIDAEHDNSLIISNNVQDTPISKHGTRIPDSCHPLIQKFLQVHENIMADQPSESLATTVELPFVKTSPLWSQIESMEIFSNVLQRPNFRQLQQHLPELREGMALGLMLSFTNLAESIKKLNVDDDNAVFEDKMKCISLLEADGFDVRHLRSRMETLLGLRNSWSEIQDMINHSEKKVAQEQIDNQQRCTEINMLSMVVHQLELHAHLFRCIKQRAISQQMSHAVENSRLKVEASELKQSSMSTEQQFSSVVAAPCLHHRWARQQLDKHERPV
uniref:Agenet domain-containing protein n=1 Tax=Leersia perrieri TaxID=77586 RepID=A0A0D9VW22_9ORYZ